MAKLNAIFKIGLLPIALFIVLGFSIWISGPMQRSDVEDSVVDSSLKEPTLLETYPKPMPNASREYQDSMIKKPGLSFSLVDGEKLAMTQADMRSRLVPSFSSDPGASQIFDNGNETIWEDETHTISDNIVIKDGGSLTLDHSNLILAGTEGTTESGPYSSSGPYETQFFYFRGQPGQSFRVSISWDNRPGEDMMDAGIYSALDYPNSSTGAPDYPPFSDWTQDLTSWALATGGSSPETTSFQIPEDKGTLFFVVVYNYAGVENSGRVTATELQCPSIFVENGGTLTVVDESRINVSDAAMRGIGILLIQNGGTATFEDSSLTDFTTLQIEANDVIVRNVKFAGPGYYDLVKILGSRPLIEDSSFLGARSGIYLENSDGAIIYNNIFADCNGMGIEAWFSSQCTITSNDIGQIGAHGIFLRWSDNFVIERNTINGVGLAGIYLRYSFSCTFTDNAMENAGGIVVAGDHADHGIHYMAGNTLAGLPILYRRDLVGGEISGSYGQVILMNVTGVTVTGLRLTDGGNIQLGNATDCIVHSNTLIDTKTIGILLWDTDHCVSSANNIAGSSPWVGIWMSNSHNGRISDNTIANFGSYGIWLDSSQNCMISSNTISDIGRIGVFAKGCSENSLISNAVMNSNLGIAVVFSESIIVSNNFLHDNWASGIVLWSSNLNTISDNEAFSNFETGIRLGNSHANVLSNNQVYANGWAGIWLEESCENALSGSIIFSNVYGILVGVSEGNTISETYSFGNARDGIQLYHSSNNNVTNSKFFHNGRWGIILFNSDNSSVSKNAIYGNSWAGLNLLESGENTITENRIYMNSEAGINLRNSHGNDISKNTLYRNSWDGIRLELSDENTISDNWVSLSWVDGISLYSSENNVATGNTVTESGADGIYLHESNNNEATDNFLRDSGFCGLHLYFSLGNSLSANTITNSWSGILLQNSNDNPVTGNSVDYSTRIGIYVYFSEGSVVTENTVSHSTDHGLYLWAANNSDISWNSFIQNNVDGISQGYDDGTGNTIENNYWDDWTSPDADGDGIVDSPYLIEGSAENEDPYPRMML